MIDAQRVDFIAVPVQDRERAARFYQETLGLARNPNSTETWIEFETGNVTLALVEPPWPGSPSFRSRSAPSSFASPTSRLRERSSRKQG